MCYIYFDTIWIYFFDCYLLHLHLRLYLSIYLSVSVYLFVSRYVYIYFFGKPFTLWEHEKNNQIYLYIKCILSLWTYRYFLYLLVYYIICVSFWLFETWIQHATLHTDTCTQTDKLGAFVFVCILGSCFIIFSFSLSHFYFAFFSCEIFFVFYFKIFAVISAMQTIKSN